MSSQVGGEYGSIRANIDVQSLEKYLSTHLPRIKLPLDVKQFKFGQVRLDLPHKLALTVPSPTPRTF